MNHANYSILILLEESQKSRNSKIYLIFFGGISSILYTLHKTTKKHLRKLRCYCHVAPYLFLPSLGKLSGPTFRPTTTSALTTSYSLSLSFLSPKQKKIQVAFCRHSLSLTHTHNTLLSFLASSTTTLNLLPFKLNHSHIFSPAPKTETDSLYHTHIIY